MAKMNSTSLYVTTNQIILKSNPANPSTWQDLYRLVPYLRNSLCCVVCGNLLVDPQTPSLGKCQHHLCRKCIGGRKRIKPACTWCKECKTYKENKHLRILLQCYKKMCMSLVSSDIFRSMLEQASRSTAVGVERGAGNLILLIREGAAFQDEYQSNVGLSKSAYSILPCVYTNSSTQTLQITPPETKAIVLNPSVHTTISNRAQYSVMYAGTGNKITIKRKPKETVEISKPPKNVQIKKDAGEKAVFKKPPAKSSVKQKKGCRCGNATATPGKLTCCGQRCPCYVESKACIECKCRGCRNPHTPDGLKVRPVLASPLTTTYPAIPLNPYTRPEPPRQEHHHHHHHHQSPLLQNVNLQLDANLTLTQLNQHFKTGSLKVIDTFPKVSPSLPQTILMNELSDEDDDDIT